MADLGPLLLAGAVTLFAMLFFGPPIVVAAAIWLIAPRFGFDVDFMTFAVWGTVIWVPIAILWLRRV